MLFRKLNIRETVATCLPTRLLHHYLGLYHQGLSPVKWCNKSGQRSAAVPEVDFQFKYCC